MEQDGQTPSAKFLKEANHSTCVVDVSVTKDNHLDSAEVDAEQFDVTQRSIGRKADVKEQSCTFPLIDDRYQ